MEDQQQMTFEEHSQIGQKLKYSYRYLEVVRAQLMSVYPKSSKKEEKALETVLSKIQILQTSLHSRLLNEFPENSDDELLPVYLGRLQSQ
ncbi:hypothetical protein [Chamaesiphon polymorphus]|uniref:Uncharacterized protein n=1 Tax=Chamaesiphon polymorphus CCALA 037 TaxID=2107692 RepID=A0A2T1GJ07_9CYAN|nr:hypothetical protein [Chamaesiphon polymorphus]PSB57749.1 hypothetical protein C7B77_07250 [Chamaesiphon polymorphus CCALA 037]